MNAFEVARSVHILAGASALGSLVGPLASRKGGALHRRSGGVYVAATAIVALTAPILCAVRLFDETPANDAFALFLLYVAAFTGATAWAGVRALRVGARSDRHRGPIDHAASLALVIGGASLAAYGARTGAPLFVAFALLGILRGVSQLRFWRRATVTRRDAIAAHVREMGSSAIGTVTAFLVVNASRFGLGSSSFLLWFGPGVLGGAAIAVWQRRAKGASGAESPRTRVYPSRDRAR